MAVDVSSLTVETITPEIMAQMTPSEIEAFKAKLTPEQFQRLAEKYGGAETAPPEGDEPVQTEATTTFVVDSQTVAEAAAAMEEANAPETPVEQKGPITFGRK